MHNFLTFHGLFEIACFAALLFGLKYLFNRYGKGLIEEGIQDREEQLDTLKSKYSSLQQEYQQAVVATEDAQKQADVILDKMKIWQKQEKTKLEKHNQERVESQERVKGYLEDQAKWFSLDHAKRDILPQALVDVEEQLKKIFLTKEKQQFFLKKVVAKFGKDAK